jgi:hypothetical protein
VDLQEATGSVGRREAEVLLSILEWVEVETHDEAKLVEGVRKLRGAVMKAGAVGVRDAGWGE